MRTVYLFCLAISFSALSLHAQKKENDISALAKRADMFNQVLSQEKVYLHFDNTGYFEGETIWFKAYLTTSDDNLLGSKSRVLYVELLDPMGNVVRHQKLKIKDGTAHGDFNLTGLPLTGFYEVRAYTRYMLNWGGECLFSRVFPIFTKNKTEGDYSTQTMDATDKMSKMPNYRQQNNQHDDSMQGHASLRFFPEGGELVSGLMSNVAFELTAEGDSIEKVITLINGNGERIRQVNVGHENRGKFTIRPEEDIVAATIKDSKGRERSFSLPERKKSGCAMRVERLNPDTVTIELDATQDLRNQLLGLAVRHHGQVLLCDSFEVTDQTTVKCVPESSLRTGVNQLTIYNNYGQVLCDRFVFKYPSKDNTREIKVSASKSTLHPHERIDLLLTTLAPNTSFSLSVRDADTQANGTTQDIATWMLLGSDLKGYINNPFYYLESDDSQYRADTDILMLVQGWRAYDMEQADGYRTFNLRHPVEDGLYLMGQLHPYKKKDTVEGVELQTNLLHDDNVLAGTAVTDKNGYYIFKLPDCQGTWRMRMRTQLDNENKKYHIGINRNFSPSPRMYSTAETRPFTPDKPYTDFTDIDGSLFHDNEDSVKSVLLDNVIVSAKRPSSRTYSWESDADAAKYSYIHYDCAAEADRIADEGRPMPTLVEWLKSKNSLFSGSDNISGVSPYRNNRYNFKDDGPSYANKTVVWIVDNRPMFVTSAPGRYAGGNEPENIDYDVRPPFPGSLDEVRDVYVSDLGRLSPLIPTDMSGMRWVAVLVYTHGQPATKDKSLRNTYFEGYSVPNKFYVGLYNNFPNSKDFRRTLLWNPDVKTDESGNARVTFYNNSTCKLLQISAEGIDQEGKPLLQSTRP